jgi:hypothetical protein
VGQPLVPPRPPPVCASVSVGRACGRMNRPPTRNAARGLTRNVSDCHELRPPRTSRGKCGREQSWHEAGAHSAVNRVNDEERDCRRSAHPPCPGRGYPGDRRSELADRRDKPQNRCACRQSGRIPPKLRDGSRACSRASPRPHTARSPFSRKARRRGGRGSCAGPRSGSVPAALRSAL